MASVNSNLPRTLSWYSSFSLYKYYRNRRVLNSLLKGDSPGYNCRPCRGRHRRMPRLRVCTMRLDSWKSKLCRLVNNNSKCWTMLTVWNLYSYKIRFREESFLTEKRYIRRGWRPGGSTPVHRTRIEAPASSRQIWIAQQSNLNFWMLK